MSASLGRRIVSVAVGGGLAPSAVIATPALAACTASSTYCKAEYSGLILTVDGAKYAEIDTGNTSNNLNREIFNDAGGGRQEVKAPYRDLSTGDRASVYVRWDWEKNGTFCYVSSIGVSAGPKQAGVTIGTGCGSGWSGYGSNTKSKYIQDSSWWFATGKKATDTRSNSMRAQTRVCRDLSFYPDQCSGHRLLGISY